jgi:transposase, IS5 family
LIGAFGHDSLPSSGSASGVIRMRPKERRDSGQSDFFRARLDQIVDLSHPLAKLGTTIDWRFLEQQFGAVYTDKPGHPPLPTRLMAGLSILKHTHNLSDEELCARWIENRTFSCFAARISLSTSCRSTGRR